MSMLLLDMKLVIRRGIRIKARYEDKVLKPLEGLDLKEANNPCDRLHLLSLL